MCYCQTSNRDKLLLLCTNCLYENVLWGASLSRSASTGDTQEGLPKGYCVHLYKTRRLLDRPSCLTTKRWEHISRVQKVSAAIKLVWHLTGLWTYFLVSPSPHFYSLHLSKHHKHSLDTRNRCKWGRLKNWCVSPVIHPNLLTKSLHIAPSSSVAQLAKKKKRFTMITGEVKIEKQAIMYCYQAYHCSQS